MIYKNKILLFGAVGLYTILIYANYNQRYIYQDTNNVLEEYNKLVLNVTSTGNYDVYNNVNKVKETLPSANDDNTNSKLYYHQRINLAHRLAELENNDNNSQYAEKEVKVQQSTESPKIKITYSIDQKPYKALLTEAETWLGTPYIWGGTTKGIGADCSGFVQSLYKSVGITLPRVSRDQSKVGLIVNRQELLPGDLLFFDTSNPRNASDIVTPTQEMIHAKQIVDGYSPNVISHVGLYVGKGKMIHAASGDGIIEYQDLDTTYYKNRFINARRIIKPKLLRNEEVIIDEQTTDTIPEID